MKRKRNKKKKNPYPYGDLDNQDEFFIDDRSAAPEYLEWIRSMTEEEFESYIERCRQKEKE